MSVTTRTTTLTVLSDEEIAITRDFAAPRELIFDLHTRPEHVTKWLLGPEGWSMPTCEIDLRPGGAWHFGWRNVDGDELEMTGEFTEVVRPERYVNTERWGGEWPETLHTTTFTERGGITTVTQVVRYPSKADRDAALATGMMSGVERSHALLDELVAQVP
ncbi:MAG TPA: SRPBCC family protein [Jatrophihabitantaceae bacterium]|jgi:uncharacterized protein YndB with AHSA1/START domain